MIQDKPNPDHKNNQTDNGHEESLYRAIRETEKEHNSRYYKARKYFSKISNRVSALTLLFVASYTALTFFVLRAATEQAWISRDSEKRGLQAYVISNKTKAIHYGFRDAQGRLKWTMYSVIENTGATPTRNLILHGMTEQRLHTLPVFQIQDHYDWKGYKKVSGRPGLIGPKDAMDGVGFETDGATLSQIAAWNAIGTLYSRFEVAGVITYDDVFGDPHHTEFCFAVHLPYANYENYPAGQAILSDADLCPTHNCADDECEE